MKLRNKINVYTTGLFIILLIIMNISIYFIFSELMLKNERDQAKAEMEKTAYEISQNSSQIPPTDLLRAYVPIDGMIQIVKENNQGEPPITTDPENQLYQRKPTFYQGEHLEIITHNERSFVYASSPIIWNDGSIVNLQVTKSIESTVAILSILKIVLLTVTLIAMIPIFISTTILSNLISRPIRSMINTMKDIEASGQFKQLELEGKSKDELFEMGSTFNHMIELLQNNFEKQEQFVSNASHELKTPITIIESYASLLKRRGFERPDLVEESLEAIHSEAVRMKDLTEQLLLLARNQEQWNSNNEMLNLTELLTDLVTNFQNAFHRKIEFISNANIEIVTDAQKLKQLLFIFLDNARKYSDDLISIKVGETGDEIYIVIEDRGIGIPKEDLPKVFDRFYRVDKARSRKHGGSGLGLSMAKEIADVIDVRIELESLEGRGTTVKLFLKS
ncbi:signal transduction histidine kinase [Metabacillus crassostreae]|uniref:sensor histidine kinase n=1 Tax=Metabacillus crassostreae TaxID=929098 RepID=UPI00195D34C5|nr:ATP-binding protein [Metabacillus crassostreae]MBM7606325.1 signal transduction histidine kinase [Metabacillus crassostreae]